MAGLFILMAAGCGQDRPAWDDASGVIMRSSVNASIPEAIEAVASASPPKAMQGSGLAGAMGGVHLKGRQAGSYAVRLPLPQMIDGQTPVCYAVDATPETALTECRLHAPADGNAFVTLTLAVKGGQEVRIDWSCVVLMAAKPPAGAGASPEPYRAATACVQSEDPQIEELAQRLWPATGSAHDYAAGIREFIRDMERKEQPASLDALGILESGQNTICTANANLACALMRARQTPCRSIATLPTIARRLEMHRIVEYADNGAWIPFDPSGVAEDIPLKPWQNIIMAKTTPQDEQAAMKPRAGAMVGCPLGHEIEFSRPGLDLFGSDFFWTMGAPLAEFEVTDEAVALTADEWRRFLAEGALSTGQLKAASARDADEYLGALNPR
jgi:hypothetical protein